MMIDELLSSIKTCTICESHLPHGVRPVLQVNSSAKVLIAGQAPGKKVHDSGIPFDDASGDRLHRSFGISFFLFLRNRGLSKIPIAFLLVSSAHPSHVIQLGQLCFQFLEILSASPLHIPLM